MRFGKLQFWIGLAATIGMGTTDLSVAQASNACQSFNLTHYWPKDSIRNQGNADNCNVFAIVGLVEAKLFQLTSRHIDLSEKDLFEQQFYGKNAAQDHAAEALRIGKEEDPSYGEGGRVGSTFKLLKTNGVCREKALPYDYDDTSSDANVLREELARTRSEIRKEVEAETGSDSRFEQFLVRQFLKDHYEEVIERKVLSQRPSIARCEEQRPWVKSRVSGYTLTTLPCWPFMAKLTKSVILNYLSNGEVILVNVANYQKILDVERIEKWGFEGHTVLITGYDCATNQFIVRNSWGANSYDRVDADLIAKNALSLHTLTPSSPNLVR